MPPRPRPPIQRLMAKVVKQDDGCWIFTGAKTKGGYGNLLNAAPGSRIYAHRLSYEHHVGPVADGMQIDHLCRTPACVNPEHLEPVTEAENHRRTSERRTHCVNGHAFTAENTYIHRGARYCRACRTERARTYAERRKP